jgi:putative membrane protein
MKRKLVVPAMCLFAAGAFAQATQNAKVSTEDRQFLEKAAQINMVEAHLGKLAQEKASSQDIKQFGEQLRTDHTDAYERLTKIANAMQVEVPKEIDSEHQSHIQRFEGVSGAEFDREFRQHQVQDHQKSIDMFQSYANSGANAELKAYASQTLTKLQSHLQTAKNLSEGASTAAADRTTPAVPADAHSATVPASTTATGNADRTTSFEEGSVHYGTVTKYQAGKTIELKMRDRSGRHSYSLSEGNVHAEVPADIKAGSQVRVIEKVDPNGRRSIIVEADTATADRSNERR